MPSSDGEREAKVEFNLVPRKLKKPAGSELPAFQVSARLECKGLEETSEDPAFVVTIVLEAVYLQASGSAMAFKEFASQHAELTRQLYPLIQQQLRLMLSQLGLEQMQLPVDMSGRMISQAEVGKHKLH